MLVGIVFLGAEPTCFQRLTGCLEDVVVMYHSTQSVLSLEVISWIFSIEKVDQIPTTSKKFTSRQHKVVINHQPLWALPLESSFLSLPASAQ